MESVNVNEVTINGVDYVRKDSVKSSVPSGNRYVLVLDRGWIVAGDVTEKDGRIYVNRALHVRGWDSIGFDGMIANPKDPKVRIKPLPNGFDVPLSCELFRVQVDSNWGL